MARAATQRHMWSMSKLCLRWLRRCDLTRNADDGSLEHCHVAAEKWHADVDRQTDVHILPTSLQHQHGEEEAHTKSRSTERIHGSERREFSTVSGLILESRPSGGRVQRDMMIVISLGSAPIPLCQRAPKNGIGGSENRSEHHARVEGKVIWHRVPR